MTAKKAALFGDTATGLRIRTITDPAVMSPKSAAFFAVMICSAHLYVKPS